MPREIQAPPAEQTLWQGSPSQWTNIVPFILCLLVIPIPWAVYRWLAVRCTRYAVTNQRLRKSTGILNRRHDDLELYRVKDITLDEPLLQRLVGLGTLTLITSDATTPTLRLGAIAGAHELRDLLRAQVEARRRERGVRELDVYDDDQGALG